MVYRADRPVPDAASRESLLRILIGSGCAVLVVLGVRLAAPVLVPFALAAFVTLASLPALMWLLRRGIPRAVAVALLVVFDSVILAVLGWAVVLSGAEIAQALPRYLARIAELEAEMVLQLQQWGVAGHTMGGSGLIQPGRWLEMAASAMISMTNLLSGSLLVLLFLIFMMREVAGLGSKLQAAFGDQATDLHRFAPVIEEVQAYFAIKTVISLLTGSLVGVATHLLGVDFALLWGLLAFLLNYIPNIGSIIAAVPTVLVALVQLGPGTALWVLCVFISVNMVLGNLIEPMVMGRRLGLSTLVVLTALVFWGWAWGVAGMFLAVPLTVVAKISLEQSARYRWLAVMMGSEPALPSADDPHATAAALGRLGAGGARPAD